MIDAAFVRDLIVSHDRARPRSKQTRIGPSDLASPCNRQLGYKLLQVPPVAASEVSLYAYVGTGIHAQLEAALRAYNARAGRERFLIEEPVSVDLGDGIELRGNMDAYDHDTATVIDWKSRGASKPHPRTIDKHRHQVNLYGLGAVMAGLTVQHTAIVYIPRNGTLRDISVETAAWDQADAQASVDRLTSLHTIAPLGPAVLPQLAVADDCRFCRWWLPGAENIEAACPGVNPTDLSAELPPWEPTQHTEGART